MPKTLHLIAGGAESPRPRQLRARPGRALSQTAALPDEEDGARAGDSRSIRSAQLDVLRTDVDEIGSTTLRLVTAGIEIMAISLPTALLTDSYEAQCMALLLAAPSGNGRTSRRASSTGARESTAPSPR